MQGKVRIWTLWFLVEVILTTCLWEYTVSIAARKSPSIATHDLCEGDVILVKTNTWRGAIVNLLDPENTDYTHVGMLISHEGKWEVVHATPTLKGKQVNQVVRESLAAFIDPTEVSKIAILSHSHLSAFQQQQLSSILLSWVTQQKPFDKHFDASNGDALYCTELVGHVFEAVGASLGEILTEKILYPSDLIGNRNLELMGNFKLK